MSFKEIRIKQGLSYISFCSFRILYKSKFILMEISLGTNAVVVTKVYCNSFNIVDLVFVHEYSMLEQSVIDNLIVIKYSYRRLKVRKKVIQTR